MPDETRIVTASIEGIKGTAQNDDGTTRYQVSANIPEISKYPMPLFVTAPSAPVPGTTLKVALRKGRLKQGKDGQYDNHYWWDVVDWDVSDEESPGRPVPTPSPQNPVAPVTNDIDRRNAERQASIEAQAALKSAVEFLRGDSKTVMDVLVAAEQFYQCIQSLQHPPQAPESPAAPSEQAAGTETPTDNLPPLSQEEFISKCKQRWDLETVNVLRTRTGFTASPSSGDYAATYDAIDREWEMMQ